jgi:two-component system, NtrC family, sensor histidine kinase KinB
VIAMASHELKTPLTAIRMNVHLLSETLEELPQRQREMLATALEGCEELATLTERFLDVARIEAGQLKLALEDVDLRQVADSIAQRYQMRCKDAGLSFSVSMATRPLFIRADAARLEVVLSNVLTNAVKYTPRGGSLVLTVGSEDGPAGRIKMTVTDSGPGIPKELQTRVFDKFFRVEHMRSESLRRPRGAGLGLYLCKQIIDAHRGTIHVSDATPSGGTRIEITLPSAST